MNVRQVDCARVEVDEGHGDAQPLQSGKLVDVHPAQLDTFSQVVRIGAAEGKGEVLGVERGDASLQSKKESIGRAWDARTTWRKSQQ